MLKRYKDLPWPLNLWSTIFQHQIKDVDLPADWEQALEHAFSLLRTEKRRDILLYFFRDNMTLQEIGDIYGTSGETVRQHAEKAIRIIRHPSIKIYLFLGLENAKLALSAKQEETAQPGANTIDSLGLSVRAWNCLKRARIETVEQLIAHTEAEIYRLRNMGAGTLNEIKECLASHGLAFRKEEDS